MSTRQIVTSTAWQMGSQVVMAALSVVTVKFVALGLTKELAGNYNSAYSYLQLFGILADFGLYAVSVREVSRAKHPEDVLGSIIVLRSIVVALSLGTAVFLMWILPTWRGTPLPVSVAIASLVPGFTLLAGILRTVFQVTYKMHFVFIAEVLQRVITLSLIGALVLTGTRASNDVRMLYFFLGIGGIGALVLFLLSLTFASRLMPLSLSFNRELLKRMVRASAPYGLAFLCVALYRQFDVTMITIMRPADYDIQNAYYGFVGRITDMTYLIPTFLLNSTLPVLTQRRAAGGRTATLLGKTLLLLLTLGSLSMLFSLLWSRPLIGLLTSSSYLSTASHPGSDTALRLLSVPMLLNGLILFSFYVMLAEHRWRPLLKTMALGVAFSIGCNLFLIPRFGFVGAAVTSIAVHVLLAFVLLPQALRILPVALEAKSLLQWGEFSALAALTLFVTAPWLTSDLRTVVSLATIGVVLPGLGWLTGLSNLFTNRRPFVSGPDVV